MLVCKSGVRDLLGVLSCPPWWLQLYFKHREEQHSVCSLLGDCGQTFCIPISLDI